MAAHSNIREPDYGDRWGQRLRVLQLEAEIANLKAERDHYQGDLRAIFTRIGKGEHIDLFFDDGRKITLRAPAQGEA